MGRISIVAFRPKPGKEDELKRVMATRLPLLRRLGMSTDRTNITMRATDGTLIDVSEWTDDAAIERAHTTPEVLELWQRFDACCSYVKLDTLAESHQDFATFNAVTL
jgi:quinol monooxygenase YgiN